MATRLDPLDELSDKSLKKIQAVTEAIHKTIDNQEYTLATDTVKVPGQNWACVSFVSPNSGQKCDSIGMKLRGVFDLHSEATEHAKKLSKIDQVFDVFVCSMYEWCLVPPDPAHISDQVYQNETLHTMITEYNKNQIYAKEHFEERKKELMLQAAEEAKQAALKKIEEEAEAEERIVEIVDPIEPVEVVEIPEPQETPSSIMDSLRGADVR